MQVLEARISWGRAPRCHREAAQSSTSLRYTHVVCKREKLFRTAPAMPGAIYASSCNIPWKCCSETRSATELQSFPSEKRVFVLTIKLVAVRLLRVSVRRPFAKLPLVSVCTFVRMRNGG